MTGGSGKIGGPPTIARGLRARGPGNMSISGNIAPRVQATIAARAVGELSARDSPFLANPAGPSRPAESAFPASAPTIPCVIVSMWQVALRFREQILDAHSSVGLATALLESVSSAAWWTPMRPA